MDKGVYINDNTLYYDLGDVKILKNFFRNYIIEKLRKSINSNKSL